MDNAAESAARKWFVNPFMQVTFIRTKNVLEVHSHSVLLGNIHLHCTLTEQVLCLSLKWLHTRMLKALSRGLTLPSLSQLSPHCPAGSRFAWTPLDLLPSLAASLAEGKPKLRRLLKPFIGMLPAQKPLLFHLLCGSPLQDVPPRHSRCLAQASMERT